MLLRSRNYVAFEVLATVVLKSSIFWDIMQRIPSKVNRRFEGKCGLHLTVQELAKRDASVKQVASAVNATYIMLVYCSAYSSILKMVIVSSETSVDFQRTKWRCIPEERDRQIDKFLYYQIQTLLRVAPSLFRQ
jgi:hypothetical protein